MDGLKFTSTQRTFSTGQLLLIPVFEWGLEFRTKGQDPLVPGPITGTKGHVADKKNRKNWICTIKRFQSIYIYILTCGAHMSQLHVGHDGIYLTLGPFNGIDPIFPKIGLCATHA